MIVRAFRLVPNLSPDQASSAILVYIVISPRTLLSLWCAEPFSLPFVRRVR